MADFTPGVREAFKVVVAQGTNLSITSAQVAITNATDVPATGRRASATVLEVSFTINTGSRDFWSAMGASSTLNKFLADPNGFLAALKKEVAKAGLKFDVTKVTVTKKASVDTPSISPTPVNYKVDSSDLAGWAIAVIIVACVVFCCIPCTLACFCFWPSIAIAIGLSHAHTEERGVAYKGDASASPPPQMQQTDMGPEPKDTTLSGI